MQSDPNELATPAPASGLRAADDMIAETIWQAEWARAGNGGSRRVPWREISDKDQERYRFVARCVLAALPASDHDVVPDVVALIERLKKPLPVCPFDRRSPDYWTVGENGAPCHVCGTTEDGPDKCRGADTRVMDDAASAIASQAATIAELRAAVQPFAWIGQWLFARDLPDETPVTHIEVLNGKGFDLTRGMFKAAHKARTRSETKAR